MKITKFEHACFTVEQNGRTLVVDPGKYTTDFTAPDNVAAVVVTHVHADHLDKDQIQSIVDKNPDVMIFATAQVTTELDGFNTQTVSANQGVKIGEFELQFFGGDHAVIFNGVPVDENLGVMINGRVYYPGDSYTVPDQPVEVLALPVAGPWLKISEVADFLLAIKPRLAFPTHDAVLSESGKGLPDAMLPQLAEKAGTKYQRLIEPLEI